MNNKSTTLTVLTILTILSWNSHLVFYICDQIVPLGEIAWDSLASWVLFILLYSLYICPAIVVTISSILFYKNYRKSKFKFQYRNWLIAIMFMNILYYILLFLTLGMGYRELRPDIWFQYTQLVTFVNLM